MTPATDGAATRRFLTPISLDTLTFLIQSGYPVDTVLRLWVERLGGVPNGPAEPDRFARAAELFRAAQVRELAEIRSEERDAEVGGALPAEAITASAVVEAAKAGIEYRPRPDGKTWSPVRKERRLVVAVSPGAEDAPELREAALLLNISPGRTRYEVVVSNRGDPDPAKFAAPPSDELRIVPRSTAQAAAFLANGVEVPPEHDLAGVARPGNAAATSGLFAVHSCAGHRPPAGAFVAIRYRDYWYSIDDRDHQSKAAFALLTQLGRLDFARDAVRGPALTLPVSR